MKRIAAVMLLAASVVGTMPVHAQKENRSIGENAQEAKKAAKQQQKYAKKNAKRQRKAMKKYQKAQRKAPSSKSVAPNSPPDFASRSARRTAAFLLTKNNPKFTGS
jgi:pyruvate kinase